MSLDTLFALATRFTDEQYLFWTRIECIAWTAADIIIVLYVLRIANIARRASGRPTHVFSFAVLAATLLFTPLVVVAQEGWTIFLAELAITVPHFLLILYVGLADLHLFPALLANILCNRQEPMAEENLRASGDA